MRSALWARLKDVVLGPFSDAGSERFVIDRLKGISDYLLSLNHRLINNNILTLDTSYNDNRINVGRYYILSQFKKYRVIIKLDILFLILQMQMEQL